MAVMVHAYQAVVLCPSPLATTRQCSRSTRFVIFGHGGPPKKRKQVTKTAVLPPAPQLDTSLPPQRQMMQLLDRVPPSQLHPEWALPLFKQMEHAFAAKHDASRADHDTGAAAKMLDNLSGEFESLYCTRPDINPKAITTLGSISHNAFSPIDARVEVIGMHYMQTFQSYDPKAAPKLSRSPSRSRSNTGSSAYPSAWPYSWTDIKLGEDEAGQQADASLDSDGMVSIDSDDVLRVAGGAQTVLGVGSIAVDFDMKDDGLAGRIQTQVELRLLPAYPQNQEVAHMQTQLFPIIPKGSEEGKQLRDWVNLFEPFNELTIDPQTGIVTVDLTSESPSAGSPTNLEQWLQREVVYMDKELMLIRFEPKLYSLLRRQA